MGGATDVRVRVLRGEEEIPAIVSLCAAVFKQVAGGGLLAAIDAVQNSDDADGDTWPDE